MYNFKSLKKLTRRW